MKNTTEFYAVIGNDGMRPVVWGIGMTEEIARQDARCWLEDDRIDVERLTVTRIDKVRLQRIIEGDVSAEDLYR